MTVALRFSSTFLLINYACAQKKVKPTENCSLSVRAMLTANNVITLAIRIDIIAVTDTAKKPSDQTSLAIWGRRNRLVQIDIVAEVKWKLALVK